MSIHLLGLKLNELASSRPFVYAWNSGQMRALPAYAASTCMQMSSRAASAPISGMLSNEQQEVVPSVLDIYLVVVKISKFLDVYFFVEGLLTKKGMRPLARSSFNCFSTMKPRSANLSSVSSSRILTIAIMAAFSTHEWASFEVYIISLDKRTPSMEQMLIFFCYCFLMKILGVEQKEKVTFNKGMFSLQTTQNVRPSR